MAKTPKTTTAPTGQIAPFGLRMLPDLKEKIEQAARESGRSMNAEIVARLEESLAKQQATAGIPTEIAAYLAALRNQSLMLDMRADMLKLRLDSIRARALLISKKTSGLDMSSLTDAELESMETEIDELRAAEAEMDAIHGELDTLQNERLEVLQSIRSVRSTVSTKVVELEKALADAAVRGLKNPTDH